MKYLTRKESQQGFVLIAGVILLLVITIITVASMRGSVTHERMGSNAHNKTVSHMAAEIGGTALLNQVSHPDFDPNTAVFTSACVEVESGGLEACYSYVVPSDTFDEPPFLISVIGTSVTGGVVLAETHLDIEWIGGGPIDIDPPAPLTCCGPYCDIDLATGGGNPNWPNVSGYDHEPPSNFNCTGNACRQYSFNNPSDPVNGYTPKPAIYFDVAGVHSTGPNINLWGGVPVVYTNPSGPTDNCAGVNLSELDDLGYTTTVGTRDEPKNTQLSSSVVSITRGAGILSINGPGAQVTMSGTGMYEGLVILRNCAQLTMSGTPHVYGAVIIMSSDANGDPCTNPDGSLPYKPFVGNGTLSILNSSTALDQSSNLGVGSGSGRVGLWRETLR